MKKALALLGLALSLMAAPAFAGGRCALCAGDCNKDGRVTVDEALTIIAVAQGTKPVSVCLAADTDGDNKVSIAELQAALTNSLEGCPK